MATAGEALDELCRRMDAEREVWVGRSDLEHWAGISADRQIEFLGVLAELLARGYHERRLPYGFCDRVANELFNQAIDLTLREPHVRWPDILHDVYEAFDEGEYHRRDDRTDDPVAEHTDPLIAALVAKLPGG